MDSSLIDKFLFPWQKHLVHSIAYGVDKYGILEKSRRIGGTWSVAIGATLYAIETGHNVWVVSLDEKTGKLFIEYIKNFCELLNNILLTKWIDVEKATSEQVRLPNNATITSLSSNPKALRAKDGLIIIDEMAWHDDQEALYQSAQGCVIQRGKVWMLSTHNGPTLFHRLSQEAEAGKPDWTHIRVTLEDAVREGYAKKFSKLSNEDYLKSVRASCLSEEAYGQEYMCRPLSLSALIQPDEYDAVAFWDVPNELVESNYNNLLMGLDVGRTHDLTVAWVIEEYINHEAQNEWTRYDYKTVCVRAIKNQPIPTQYALLSDLFRHPSMRMVSVDQGTVGRTLSDMIAQDHNHIHRACNFAPSYKAKIAEQLKGYVQAGRLSLPKDDLLIRNDLLSLKREASKAGHLSYNGSTGSTHCDYFWAAAMAIDSAIELNGLAAIIVS